MKKVKIGNRHHFINVFAAEEIERQRFEIEQLRKENSRLDARLNSPEIHDFSDAVVREAAHQRERWPVEHDDGKSAIEWLWLIAFLATKATQAERYGDHEKYLHHIITTAAACCNWHSKAAGPNHLKELSTKGAKCPDCGLEFGGDLLEHECVPEQDANCSHQNTAWDDRQTERCLDCGDWLPEKGND